MHTTRSASRNRPGPGSPDAADLRISVRLVDGSSHEREAISGLHLVELSVEGHLPGEGLAGLAGDLDPVDDRERLEKFRLLDAALQQLSEEHRVVVLLHDTEGYKMDEIESLIGVPVGTVKSRLHRARARLRQILDDDGTIS